MRNHKDNNDQNIIYFPNIDEKLLEKGLEALKNNHYHEALRFFQQLLELKPGHSQAYFGKAISLFELGKLEEAKDMCEQMLQTGNGPYYDVLKVYTSILIQLGEYAKVVDTLEAVIQEEKLPANDAETFYQMLRFSRKMLGDENLHQTPTVDKRKEEQLIRQLHSPDIEKQWAAIQQFAHGMSDETREVLKRFLRDSKKDPFLKSMILQIFRAHRLNETVYIHKCSETIAVNPTQLPETEKDKFFNSVLSCLRETLEQDNPTLYELCLNIWLHFLFTVFPIDIVPKNERSWAAAIHYVCADYQGIGIEAGLLAERYNSDVREIIDLADKIMLVEASSFQGFTYS